MNRLQEPLEDGAARPPREGARPAAATSAARSVEPAGALASCRPYGLRTRVDQR
jgi:hypothetical protein